MTDLVSDIPYEIFLESCREEIEQVWTTRMLSKRKYTSRMFIRPHGTALNDNNLYELCATYPGAVRITNDFKRIERRIRILLTSKNIKTISVIDDGNGTISIIVDKDSWNNFLTFASLKKDPTYLNFK